MSISESAFGSTPSRAEPKSRANKIPGSDSNAWVRRVVSMRFDIGFHFRHICFDIPQFLRRDSIENGQIDTFILMNQEIAKADHRNVATGILNHPELLKPLHDRS